MILTICTTVTSVTLVTAAMYGFDFVPLDQFWMTYLHCGIVDILTENTTILLCYHHIEDVCITLSKNYWYTCRTTCSICTRSINSATSVYIDIITTGNHKLPSLAINYFLGFFAIGSCLKYILWALKKVSFAVLSVFPNNCALAIS